MHLEFMFYLFIEHILALISAWSPGPWVPWSLDPWVPGPWVLGPWVLGPCVPRSLGPLFIVTLRSMVASNFGLKSLQETNKTNNFQ